MKTQIILKLTITGAIVMVLFYIEGCIKKEYVKPPDVAVNSAFEMFPPEVEDISIKELDKEINGGNLLVEVRFKKDEVLEKYHALMIDEEKIILRDDGQGEDSVAGDGIFSVAIKENMETLNKEFSDVNSSNMKNLQRGGRIFKFENRSAIPLSDAASGLFKEKKIVNFKDRISLDPSRFFVPVPDPALKDHSLMITDLGVVEDPTRTFNPCLNTGNPNGSWTFGELMKEMANQASTMVDVEEFTRQWLNHWMTNETVNTQVIPARPAIFNSIIKPWLIRSNPATTPASITTANWKTFHIEMKFAPFKLLAIVNRLDLRGNIGYGVGNAGEGRFVFGMLTSSCSPMPGTVIFEYGIPKHTCSSLKAFGQQWHDLLSLTPGAASFNSALQAITDQFTKAGTGGKKPNGSCLNQLRTNEIAFSGPWELREFAVDSASHLLISTTTKKEPIEPFNSHGAGTNITDQTFLGTFVNVHETEVKKNSYSVNEIESGRSFLGGRAHTLSPGHFWDAVLLPGAGSITNDTARHNFSLNTCSGCHGGEGKTSVGPNNTPHASFLHISPEPFGQQTTLSAFLTGNPSDPQGLFRVNDPAGRSPVWTFNDLQNRAQSLEELVTTACRSKTKFIPLLAALRFKPIRMEH